MANDKSHRPSPHLVHSFDQLGAVLGEAAPLLYGFHERLTGAGFTDEQALTLVRDLLRLLAERTGAALPPDL